MDHFPITAYSDYVVVSLKGELRLHMLPTLTPQLSTYIHLYPGRSFVLDLSDVSSVDSSTLRLFLNLKKRVEANKTDLYLLRPSKEILDLLNGVNLDKVFNVIQDSQELQHQITHSHYKTFLPYTTPEKSMLRLKCSCAVCGSKDVIGYLIDQNSFAWKWGDDSYYPICSGADNKVFDYYSALPIICLDCFTTSIDITHFNIVDDSGIVYKSSLDETSKQALSKSIKKRKKVVDADLVIGDTFFLHPRERAATYITYILAESCARTIALHKSSMNPFLIGYMNYCAIKYADESLRDDLIDNCRTWITQMFLDKSVYNPVQLSQAYFIILIASMSLDKLKEATAVFQDFSRLIESIPKTTTQLTLDNPSFWFSRAEAIWRHEIESKSASMHPVH